MPETPNVLVLLDDQHHPDILGYAGDDVVETPTIDWLAETGTVFTNAYTPAPVCVPARHSIRTGQLPRTFARDDVAAYERGDYPTYPLQAARQGYLTASAGKEHYPGWNQHVGWRKRIGPTPMKQHGVPDHQVPDPAPAAEERAASVADWKWSGATELERAGVANSRTQVQDRRVTEGIEQYFKEVFTAPYYDRCQPDRPVVAKLSLIEPHYPYFAADEDRFTYYLNRVEPNLEPPGSLHPVVDEARTVGECRIVRPGEDVTERTVRRATAAYYAMVERVDDLFGRAIDALEHHGEDPDEWVIIFASDHGELLGERGMWGKGQFLESSANVPLVIRYPERFDPGVVEQNVSLCDLFATICDLIDAPVPSGRDSRSLVGLMDGETDEWTDEAVVQDVSNGSLFGDLGSDHLMIKQGDLKYCYYGEDEPELLLDLNRDPRETTNFVDDPSYEADLEQFRERRAELGYGPDADPDYENAGYDPGVPVE